MKRAIKISLFLLPFLSCTIAWSAPSISGVSGTFSGNADDSSANLITISGSGFGTVGGPPLIWATFEGGLTPTALGAKQTWTEQQHAVSTTTIPGAGTKCMTGDSSYFGAIMNVMTSVKLGYGKRLFALHKRRVNHGYKNINLKEERLWDVCAGCGYPDSVLNNNGGAAPGSGGPNGSDLTNTTEYSDGTQNSYFDPDPKPEGRTQNWEYRMTRRVMNSSNHSGDAQIEVRIDSVSTTKTGLDFDSISTPGDYDPSDYSIEEDPANGSFSDGEFTYFDDVYIATTDARVMLINNATLSLATTIEMVIPKTWAATSIAGYFHQGRFANGASAWIVVCDENNSCSTPQSITVGNGTTQLAPFIVPIVQVSSFSVNWSSAGAGYIAVMSKNSDFSSPISSGALTGRTTSYATNLAQRTTYYFEVKVATDPDSGYSGSISTATSGTVLAASVGSPTQTSLTGTWSGAMTINRVWDDNSDFSSPISSGSASSPDTQGSLTCNTQYYFEVKVASETAYDGNIFSGTTSACSAATNPAKFGLSGIKASGITIR